MKLTLQLIKNKLTVIFTLISFTIFGQWTQFGGDLEGTVNSSERFGRAVSLSADGSVMAVGAYRDGDAYDNFGNLDKKGAVRIYTKNTENEWIESAEILGSEVGENFGRSLSFSADGSILAIGSPNYGDGEIIINSGSASIYTSKKGAVKVYSQDASGNWNQIGVDIVGAEENNYLGFSINLSDDGNTLAAGAYGNNNNTGLVSIYNLVEGNWIKEADIVGTETGEQFGWSLSLSGNASHIAIGAPANNESTGTARIYNKTTENNWEQLGANLNGASIDEYAGFSIGLSLDGATVAVGAYGYNNTDGSVSIYNYESNEWALAQQINGIEGELEEFGYTLHLTPNATKIAIGAIGFDFYNGLTRVYENTGNEWVQKGQDVLSGAPAFSFVYSGTAVSLSDDGSILASGIYAYNSSGGHTNDGLVKTYEFTDGDDTLSLNENTIENLNYTVVDNRIKVNNDSVGINAIYNFIGQSVANSNLNGLYIVIFENNSTKKQQAKKIFIN